MPRINCADIAMRPMRLPRIAAIGASSTGGAIDGEPRIGKAEIVYPGDFGIEAQHLPHRQQNSDRFHADDERVQARIGHESDFDLLVQHEGNQPDQDDEDQHPEQEDARG